MKVKMLDDPCTYLVTSESDGEVSYVVDLCLYPLGHDADGNMDFNGACISTRGKDEWLEHGCSDFIYRCLPNLKVPGNTKVYRCKHCRAGRDYAFRSLLPYVAKQRPQQKED